MSTVALESADVALKQLTVAYREHTAVQALTGEFITGSLTAVVGRTERGNQVC